jgi:hypothetical protein
MDTLSGDRLSTVSVPVANWIARYSRAIPMRIRLLAALGIFLVMTMLFGSSPIASQVATATECDNLSRAVAPAIIRCLTAIHFPGLKSVPTGHASPTRRHFGGYCDDHASKHPSLGRQG